MHRVIQNVFMLCWCKGFEASSNENRNLFAKTRASKPRNGISQGMFNCLIVRTDIQLL